MLRKSILFLLISLTFSLISFADDRRGKILDVINEELSEVKRLADEENLKNPETLFRISELYLEKARIQREIDNQRFLNLTPEERRIVKKSDYFKTSSSFYLASNKYALNLVKRFPSYKRLGEVFFFIASNFKEVGNHESAAKFFNLSGKKSNSNNKTRFKSLIASAEYDFNNKKFQDAAVKYEAGLANTDEKWWTKDAFNYAWSLYRINKLDKAISLMREIHNKSKSQRYVDMRALVERDLGFFFVDAKKFNEAIKFYEDCGLDYTSQFTQIAETIISQGRFLQAEKILDELSKREKNPKKRVQLLLSQLLLFDKYDKVSSHFKSAEELTDIHEKSKLSKEDLKRLVFQVDKKAAELQKSATSELYKNAKKTKELKADFALKYFELSYRIDPAKKSEKTFYQAETMFSLDKYEDAIKYYIFAFDNLASENNSLKERCLDGMLSSLSSESNKERIEKYYAPVYSRYLQFDKKSEKARTIYLKLFNSQYSGGNISGSELTLADFARNFPNEIEIQEGMIAKIMDYFRQRKDHDKLNSYVKDINKGKFRVSKKYNEAIKILLTKIQIEGVQKSLDAGNKADALNGYLSIYQNPESTQKAKVNSAYNLSVLYFELGNTDESYKWAKLSLEIMDKNDVNNFSNTFLSISSSLYLQLEFEKSFEISKILFSKICTLASKNKDVAFKNSLLVALSILKTDLALELLDKGSNCNVNEIVLRDLGLEVLKDLAKERRWESYEKLLLALESNPKNAPFLILPFEEIKNQYVQIADNEKSKEIDKKQNQFFHQSVLKNLDLPNEARDLIAEKMIFSIRKKHESLKVINLQFPEEQFNRNVKSKLQILDTLTLEIEKLKKTGSGRGLVEGYLILISSYDYFLNELKSFSPEGKSEDYLTSFRKAMEEVIAPLAENSKRLTSDVQKIIYQNKILSPLNGHVLLRNKMGTDIFFENYYGVFMERRGRK